MTAQSVVQLHEVSVRLGPVWALKGIELCVQPGERVALVGAKLLAALADGHLVGAAEEHEQLVVLGTPDGRSVTALDTRPAGLPRGRPILCACART